jgi:hypothetical protein
MSGQFTTQGDYLIFNSLLGANTLTCHLFTNSTTPSKDSPSFTECSAAGYAAQTLTAANWTNADGTTNWGFTYPTNITFTLTGSSTIYGYWISNGSTNIWYEVLSGGPYTFGSSGGSLVINPIQMTVT